MAARALPAGCDPLEGPARSGVAHILALASRRFCSISPPGYPGMTNGKRREDAAGRFGRSVIPKAAARS